MKLCHLMPFTPHRSGLYETAREIVEAENKLGHEARFLDSKGAYHPYLRDRGIQSCGLDYLQEAEAVVMHQMPALDIFKSIKVPIVLVLHGTPKDCFWGDLYEGMNSYKTILSLINDPRMSFITLWERHLEFWKPIMGKKVSYAPSCVNLSSFNPTVEPYKFSGSSQGSLNILFGDTWRIDKNPFEIMHAFKYFKETELGENARLHVYCKSTRNQDLWSSFLYKILDNKDCYLGEYSGMIQDFPNVIRACDFVVTPQRDATRVIRESLALGVPVVALNGCGYTRFTADHYYPKQFAEAMECCARSIQFDRDFEKTLARRTAEREFDPKNTAVKVIEHIEERL